MNDNDNGPVSVQPISTVDRLVLPRSVRDAFMVHLIKAAPHEGVGLLAVGDVVPTEQGLEVRAERFYPGTNVDRSPSRYTMDAGEVVRAFRDMQDAGLRHGAIVHSHLKGPATPSVTDIREAMYPDVLMVIVSLADQPATTGVWRLVPEDGVLLVQAVDLMIIDGA